MDRLSPQKPYRKYITEFYGFYFLEILLQPGLILSIILLKISFQLQLIGCLNG